MGDAMNNNKGLTLLEVLATITLITVVLAVGMALLSNVNFEFRKTGDRSQFNRQMNDSLNVISKHLTDCSEVYLMSANEIRMITGEGTTTQYLYKTLVADVTAGTLTLYEISKANYDAKGAIDYTVASNYTKRTVLATNLRENTPLIIKKKVVNTTTRAVTEAVITPVSEILNSGEIVNIEIPFEFQQTGVSGSRSNFQETRNISIKILKLQ
jgi:prepilin-type N-terminal cleavage/methylation domain-containing protein